MKDETKALMGLYHGMTACKKNRFGTPSHQVRYLVYCTKYIYTLPRICCKVNISLVLTIGIFDSLCRLHISECLVTYKVLGCTVWHIKK